MPYYSTRWNWLSPEFQIDIMTTTMIIRRPVDKPKSAFLQTMKECCLLGALLGVDFVDMDFVAGISERGRKREWLVMGRHNRKGSRSFHFSNVIN